jgi:hypothetical protein
MPPKICMQRSAALKPSSVQKTLIIIASCRAATPLSMRAAVR